MTGKDVPDHATESYPKVTSVDRKSVGSGCRRPISQVLVTFELLQGCNSQEVAEGLLEVAVEGL